MNRMAHTTVQTVMILLSVSVGAAFAQNYEIDWHTVDSGGEMWSTGGDYELGSTIGQPDAQADGNTMSGGTYTLTGGFWATPPCWCLADLNNDGLRNGDDIQTFVNCITGGGSNCACADLETNSVLDMADVATFVDDLLTGANCP